MQVPGIGAVAGEVPGDRVHAPQGVAQFAALGEVRRLGVLAGQPGEQQRRLAGQGVQGHAVAIVEGTRDRQAVLVQVVEQVDEERQLLVLALLEQGQHQLASVGGDEEGAVLGAGGHALDGDQRARVEAAEELGDLRVGKRCEYGHVSLAREMPSRLL